MSVQINIDQIKNACCGKSLSQGGLNINDMQIVLKPHLGDNVFYLDKDQLIYHLCQIYPCETQKFSEKYYRDMAKIINTIETNPKYEDMRPNLQAILQHWTGQSCCQLCGLILEIESNGQMLGRQDAIDHIHQLEETGINSYRGRLCVKCNLQEGHAKKSSNGNFYAHVKILSDKLRIDPIIIYTYLYDTYHGSCPMDTR
jgi:hypothetical protein